MLSLMHTGHVIEIEENFDQKRQAWDATITLKEFRQSKQYGGALVWNVTYKDTSPQTHDCFMRLVVDHVKREVLSLLTFKIK